MKELQYETVAVWQLAISEPFSSSLPPPPPPPLSLSLSLSLSSIYFQSSLNSPGNFGCSAPVSPP